MEHWAIKIGEYWFEIMGTSKKDLMKKNEIVVHKNNEKYDSIDYIGQTKWSLKEIKEWSIIWLENHPIYSLNGDNCQKYVKELIEFCVNKSVNTQNSTFGDISIKTGISMLLGGGVLFLGGLMIKGSH